MFGKPDFNGMRRRMIRAIEDQHMRDATPEEREQTKRQLQAAAVLSLPLGATFGVLWWLNNTDDAGSEFFAFATGAGATAFILIGVFCYLASLGNAPYKVVDREAADNALGILKMDEDWSPQ